LYLELGVTLGIGAGRVTGTFVLGEIVLDPGQGKFQTTIDLAVVAPPGALAPEYDRPKLLGIIEMDYPQTWNMDWLAFPGPLRMMRIVTEPARNPNRLRGTAEF
jgi:hypothetical protein